MTSLKWKRSVLFIMQQAVSCKIVWTFCRQGLFIGSSLYLGHACKSCRKEAYIDEQIQCMHKHTHTHTHTLKCLRVVFVWKVLCRLTNTICCHISICAYMRSA